MSQSNNGGAEVSSRPAIASPNDKSKSVRKQYKYLKPRIGSSFQIRIEPFKDVNDSVCSPLKPEDQLSVVRESETLKSSKQLGLTNDSVKAGRSVTHTRKKRGPGRPRSSVCHHASDVQRSGVPLPTMTTSTSTASLASTDISSSSTSSSSRTKLNGHWVNNVLVPNRGGLCVHKPVVVDKELDIGDGGNICTEYDEFLTFARNIMLHTPREVKALHKRTDYVWKEATSKGRFGEIDPNSIKDYNSGRRGKGKKRKLMSLPEDDSIAWGSMNNISKASKYSSGNCNDLVIGNNLNVSEKGKNDSVGLEEDELMLEYLQLHHHGCVDRAKFFALSEYSMGIARKTRKYLRKKKREEDIAAPLSAVLAPLSESWRRRYERFGQYMVGDTRRRPGVCHYPFILEGDNFDESSNIYPWTQKSCKTGKKGTFESDINKNPLNTWRSILQYGQNVVESIEKKDNNQPKLRDVLILLSKAYSIQKPEEVFGRRDVIAKQIALCMNSILDHVDKARNALACIYDSLFDKYGDGIDLNNLKKILESEREKNHLYIDEFDTITDILGECLSWQSKFSDALHDELDQSSTSEDLNIPKQSLLAAQDHVLDGKMLSLRPQSLVLLEKRIERADNLRCRIVKWSKSQTVDSENVKFINSMIKEANRINLNFPELSILSKLHRNAEEWIDRATIAIRSKISLSELESLVVAGEKMPVDLSDLLGKLKNRYKQACEWVAGLNAEVPCPTDKISISGNDVDDQTRIKWFAKMREALNDENEERTAALLNHCTQGSRIAVEIEFLKMLQTAFEAKNWSLKAKRWIPGIDGEIARRGKIEDLREHLIGAASIRSKVKLLLHEEDLVLENEKSLLSVVNAADEWFEKHQSFLFGDNRRTKGRTTISIRNLQQIVQEADSIPANLGNASIKVNRIYNQVHSWLKDHHDLLYSCCIDAVDANLPGKLSQAVKKSVTFEEINNAIDSASKEISVDLVEVQHLNTMVEKVQHWFDRANLFAPKRNKRGKKDCQEKHTMEEVVNLIEESPSIPMDTHVEVGRLRMLLSDVQSWRIQVHCELREIANSFKLLREARIGYYGEPEKFIESMMNGNKDSTSLIEDCPEQPLASIEDCQNQNMPVKILLSGGKNVYKMVANVVKSAESVNVVSFEEEVTQNLQNVAHWCKEAAKIIASPIDVFIDKMKLEDLVELINSGENLLSQESELESKKDQFDDEDLIVDLNKS